jgi:hypothetical protein
MACDQVVNVKSAITSKVESLSKSLSRGWGHALRVIADIE